MVAITAQNVRPADASLEPPNAPLEARRWHPIGVYSAAALDAPTREFYLRVLDTVKEAGVRYVVAGAYALAYHAGIVRHTKDLDLFVRRQDVPLALEALEAKLNCRSDWAHPHWLAKSYAPESDETNGAFVDFIFRSANGLCPVDDEWLDHACPGDVLGRSSPLCPAEEMVWSKAWVQARERFDGADIAHLIQARGPELDWRRLLDRFLRHSVPGAARILLGHLLSFGFVYPAERDKVPAWVLEELFGAARNEPPEAEPICRGTMLSWDQYLPDVTERGSLDARLRPWGRLTQEEVDGWTAAPK
jgi:hypothetical protein